MLGFVSAAVSDAGERILADEEVSGAEAGRTFQQQHGAQRRQGRGKPRAVQLAFLGQGPGRQGEIVLPGEFFSRGGKIGVLNLSQFVARGGEQRRRFSQGGGGRRRVKLVQKICQAAVE